MFGRILADIDRPFPFLKARMYENMGLTEKLKGKKKESEGISISDPRADLKDITRENNRVTWGCGKGQLFHFFFLLLSFSFQFRSFFFLLARLLG